MRPMLNKAKQWGYVCESPEFDKLALPEASMRTAARFFSAGEARWIIGAAPPRRSTQCSRLSLILASRPLFRRPG
jgi:hypothetical protein